MILLAESGSTSTNWRLVSPTLKIIITQVDTKGLNPFHVSKDEIIAVIEQLVVPAVLQSVTLDKVSSIYFYGAGCSNDSKKEIIASVLKMIFQNAAIIVDHDVLASAIACCGDDVGIACILGTGSNSCVYDGKNIVKTLPSLGYILGDEGSGTHIGKEFLQLLLKNKLPSHLLEAFNKKYQLTALDILNHIYQKEKPGVFIAGFASFVIDNIEEQSMYNIVHHSFNSFFDEFILPYPESKSYPINFVGSIAALLSDILKDIGSKRNLFVNNIVRYPIDALVDYHLNKF
ncbi:MAG TPA: ATPase [Bacteroidales bacterium]|nr:ATPase [Bacteroidales bacterium]HOR81961.1 ATPase [Bacteroidales bacterium]HPJ91484.1 ATPase [Bacteroidales bacterium]